MPHVIYKENPLDMRNPPNVSPNLLSIVTSTKLLRMRQNRKIPWLKTYLNIFNGFFDNISDLSANEKLHFKKLLSEYLDVIFQKMISI